LFDRDEEVNRRTTAITLTAALAGLAFLAYSRSRSVEPSYLLKPQFGVIETAAQALPLPPDAFFEAAVVTAESEAAINNLLKKQNLAPLLQRHDCGAGCEDIRALLGQEPRVSFEIMDAERWTLPPRDKVTPAVTELSQGELTRLYAMPRVVIIRTRDAHYGDAVAARAGFALTALLARMLHGYVHDEVRDRLYSAEVAGTLVITSPKAAHGFRPEHISLTIAPDDRESDRLLTRGMRRFGAPDLQMSNVPRRLSLRMAQILNALATRIANGEHRLPLHLDTASEASITFAFSEAPMAEGHPDNDVLEVGSEASFEELASAFSRQENPDEVKAAQKHVQTQWASLEKAKMQGARVFLRLETQPEGGRPEAVWTELVSCEATRCKGADKLEFEKQVVSGYQKVDPAGGVISFPEL
jgi:hypothetical protein